MKTKVLVLVAVGVGLALLYFRGKPAISAENHMFQLYEITIQGTVAGRSFSRGGAIFARPIKVEDPGKTGTNQVGFWLVSGKPSGTAGKGAIWLASDNGFYGGQATEEFALVSALDHELTVQLHPELDMTNANAFSISSDSNENANQLLEGRVHLKLHLDGRVEGTIDLVGLDPVAEALVHYTAAISGSYAGTRTW